MIFSLLKFTGVKLPTIKLRTIGRLKSHNITIEGNYVIVVSSSDKVTIKQNNVAATYDIVPNKKNIIRLRDNINTFACNYDTNIIYIKLVIPSPTIESLGSAFRGNTKMQAVDISKVNTTKIWNIGDICRDCPQLQSMDISVLDNNHKIGLTGAWAMGCTNLQKVNANFNMRNLTSMGALFRGCYNLTDLIWGYDCAESLEFQSSPLTHKSAMSVINGMARIAGIRNITFSKQTYNTLTKEEIALATSKGWSVASS